jgi:hypothetical protein
MSRLIKPDFQNLLKFIDEYSLSSFKNNQNIISFLSNVHKKYYAFMALISELDNTNKNDGSKLLIDKQRDYLLESLSDVGNSIFLMINGAYKPSKLMLRSSIETFLKGLSIDELTDIDKEKKIYKMFDNIKATTFFNIEPRKSLFNELNQSYGELSKDIHTATKKEMQHTSSLNYFPTKSEKEFKTISETSSLLISNYITLVCFKFNLEFHQIHHGNKKIILESIKKQYRPDIMNIV